MSREELKSDHRDTKVDAIEERPGWGLKVLVVGEKTLERKALEDLRNQGLGVQTTSLDRFEIVSGTYGPDAVVCSERCLRSGLGEQLRQDDCDFSVVVLRHGAEPISSISSKLTCSLVVIPPGETPLRVASLVHEAAKRARDRRGPKAPSPRTLPSAARSKDSSPPPAFPPPPLRPSIYPEPDEDEPTKMYATRDFFPEELTPPSSYRSPSEHPFRDSRDTAVTPSTPPTSMRLPLSSRGQHLNGVRVALVDVDPTRTDAIAVALRARRAEVHIASLNSDRPRFRLLRKFAPHALLIDEDVLANDGLQFLQTFREDPFLQHTQLLTLRFDRLFRVRSGTASIESVKDLLEPLGRAETALLSQLGPSVEVEFDLDQFPPHRLIKMLARRKAPTTIVCTREKETFRWTVANGRTGRAEVWHAAHPEPCVLPPDEALDWLLSHKNCHVVLVEPTDYDEVTGRSVIPLVENKESGMWELPHLLATQQAPSVRKRIRHGSQPDSLGPVSIRPRPITSRLLFGNQLSGGKSKWLLRLGGASLAIGALLGLLIFREGGAPPLQDGAAQQAAEQRPDREQPETPSAQIEQKPVASAPPPIPAKKPEKTPLDLDAPGTDKHAISDPETLFLVTSAEDVPCEDVVGVWSRPVNARLGLSNMHYRSAQKLLVEGRANQAHVELCKSAILNPAGPGSELLAQFSLSQRATIEAERWISEVLKGQPESRTARELLGDVLHQQGRHDEALKVWFEALDVKAEDMAKRKAVARVWVGHSRIGLGAADYPRAERSLRRALAFDPSNAEAASLLSIVFRRRNNPDRADAWEKEAARLRGAR